MYQNDGVWLNKIAKFVNSLLITLKKFLVKYVMKKKIFGFVLYVEILDVVDMQNNIQLIIHKKLIIF